MTADGERYFLELAAAFVRGSRPDAPALAPPELVAWGRAAGLRIHKFKRNASLPRVRRVLGMLQAMAPQSLVDIGSGRGTFLWPLLATFPELQVTAVDLHEMRVRDLSAVRAGGIERLEVLQADAQQLPLSPDSVDVVTLLEVLEHLPDPGSAATCAVSVARRHVIATVPDKEDDNPQHIQRFDRTSLQALLAAAGAARVTIEHVPGHLLAVARVGS